MMKRESILIEADELLGKIDDPNIRIYDATILFFQSDSKLTAYEQYLQSHIPGAAFFDHQKFSDSNSKYMYIMLPEKQLATQIGDIGISEETEVILYTSGMLACATRAWWILRYAGHNNVRVLNGGLSAWEAVGGKIESGGNAYKPTNFDCRLRPEMFATKEDVMTAMKDESVNLEYTLDIEAFDGVYIPGSSLLPAGRLMQESASLLSENELKDYLKVEQEYESTITYCGGGIAATVNAIAYLMAGKDNIAVYDGSLSEWIGEGLPTTTVENV